MPKISVVIPNYNHSAYLEQSIASVINQTSYPDEILIIDDGSTDNSPEIIKKYENLRNIRTIYRKENKGVLYNINECLKLAKGDFILFLAADDFLDPHILQEYRPLIEKHPDVGFFCSLSTYMLTNGRTYLNKPSSKIPSGYIPPTQAKSLIYKYDIWPWFSGNTILLNKRRIIENGGYDRCLQSYSDGFLYLNLALKHGLVFVAKSLSTYRKRPDSYSASVVKDIDKLSLIEKKVVAVMKASPEYFDEAFIKRWQNRWHHLKFTSHFLYGDTGIFLKFVVSTFIFLRYRWFDIFNLRWVSLKSFFRNSRSRKIKSL